jgi:hypothetical protein
VSPGRCIHCLRPGPSPCRQCLELIADIGADDYVEPPPRPAPVIHTGRFEPSQADVQAYCELSERGAFRPFDQVRPKQLPHHVTNRWGKAIASLKRSRRDPDIPTQ